MRRVDIQAGEVRWDDDQRLIVEGVPFTGEAVTHNWLDEITSLITYVDGFPEGARREWYDGEELKSEHFVHKGQCVGTAREWHPNGQLARQRWFDERGLPSRERRWGEDGRSVCDGSKNGDVGAVPETVRSKGE